MEQKDINSICLSCVHLRRIKLSELKSSYKMRCALSGRFMKEPKSRCRDYESETWERFLEDEK